MPDYERARTSDNGRGDYVGVLPNSERYMALTVMLSGNVYDAIRVVTSLDRIDRQINTSTLVIAVLSAGVMLLVLLLGMYFIKSIVSPLRQIGNSARRLASGDFSDRVELSKNDDEIGELCRVFNSMADDLENSEKIKNDFISSVSHELRTPLTAIRGWSETVTETGTDDKVIFDKGMRVITSETSRLSDMVEDLLDFSKMQSGRFKLQKTNMDALAELADAVSVFTERAKKEGTTLFYIEPEAEETAIIFGDKNRIRQVFINVIDNALKYSSPSGMVAVDAAIENEKLIINVSDNGCGISEKDLPKVKNRFFKANNSVRGSGIGLAVADEIIAMHEGFLDIESEHGKGTTVTITLPTKLN
jgi:signal transduction histidine kinase